MALNPQTLIDELMKLDEPCPPNPASAAQRWFDAWWKYAKNMSHLNQGMDALAQGVFVPALLPGLIQANPLPVFFAQLEAAMRATWTALGTPVGLKQDLPPAPGQFQRLSIIPAPAPFVPLGVATVAIGMAIKDSSGKNVQRKALGTAIHGWTMTHMVVANVWTTTPSGLTPVPGPPLPFM